MAHPALPAEQLSGPRLQRTDAVSPLQPRPPTFRLSIAKTSLLGPIRREANLNCGGVMKSRTEIVPRPQTGHETSNDQRIVSSTKVPRKS
jgi:hypothetical protein